MKKFGQILKAIFLGKIGMIPLWFIYMMVGMMINVFSIYGVNGVMQDIPQVNSMAMAVGGIIIALFGAPGIAVFLASLIIGWFCIKIKL